MPATGFAETIIKLLFFRRTTVRRNMSLSPRKKFTLQGEIKCALARFKHQYNGTWNFIPDRRVVGRLIELYSNKFLYVKGSAFETMGLERRELLMYLLSLPGPEAKEAPTGSKLRAIPLFYSSFHPPILKKCYNGSIRPPLNLDAKAMLEGYKSCERAHKGMEGHHPDGLGWHGGVDASIECVFDVYNSLLRTNSVKSAYAKLLNILMDEKFANLDTDGILFAALHIIIRGVSGSTQIHASADWRRETVTQELLFKVSSDYINGIPPASLIAAYRAETTLHSSCIRSELTRLRISRANKFYHDYSKFQNNMVFFYSWHWGVYQRFNDHNKKMFELGLDFSAMNNFPTGITSGIGSALMEGAMSSPEMNKILELARQLPDAIASKIDQSTEKAAARFDELAEERETSLIEKAKEVLELARSKSTEVVDQTLEKVVTQSSEIGTAMMSSFEPAFEILNSLTGILKGVVDQVTSFLTTVPGFTSLDIKITSLFEALKYYIMYVNTHSTSLKMILIILILHSLGVSKLVFTEIVKFWTWSKGVVNLDGQEVGAEETSILEWATEAPSNLLSLFGGVIAYLAKGASLTSKEFMSLSATLARNMRNFHFIGAGISGLTKIFDYFMKFWQFTSEWIMENFFGRTPESVQLAEEVSKLLNKIGYFGTEAGLNAIRMSEGVRVQAERIMPAWSALLLKTRDKPSYRNMFMDLERKSRQVKEISNFITRFRSVSNFQPTMFHIQLVGRPGIGKSTITKNIVTDLTKSLWPDEPNPSFYSMNMNLEFFDGYAGQRIMIADDLYKMNEPKHLTATIGLVTNTPVILPMADLADKGQQLTSEVLLSSTNTPYPIGKDVLCMEAVHRRRHMLVEVICDDRVIDKNLGQFSKALFDKYYPGKKVDDMPHLTFGLLKPVPSEFGGANVQVSEDDYKIFSEYAKKLADANHRVCMARGDLCPTFFFSEDNCPPGISFPATGWNYQQFISNCVVRFRAFKGMEGTYSSTRKFGHVEQCLAEIDSLFDQRDEISNGTKLPRHKILEQYMQECMHPYGSLDPLGERIAAGENVAPELDNIDIDAIIDNVVSDRNAQPTGVSLTEEQQRAKRILARKQKVLEPTALRNRLKVENKNNMFLISLDDHPTTWDSQPEYSPDVKFRNAFLDLTCRIRSHHGLDISYLKEDSKWYTVLAGLIYETVKEDFQMNNAALRFFASAEMVFPSGFGELSGSPTGFPISFFRDIVKIDSQYYLDISSMYNPNIIRTIQVTKNGQTFTVPFDIAFCLNQMSTFKVFLSQFNSFSLEQQELLISEAKWRSQYLGSYTYARIAQDCRNIFEKMTCKTLDLLTSPFRFILDKFPLIVAIAASTLAYIAVIWTVRRIGELFNPTPTSKVLHRGPQSNIVYHGRPTANENFTSLVDPLFKRNVRKITIQDSNVQVSAQALFTEQFVLLNKHLLKWLVDPEFSLGVQYDGVEHEYIINRLGEVYQDPNGDLAIIFSRALPAARKICHHFMSRDEYMASEFSKPLVFLSRLNGMPFIEHYPAIGKRENLTLQNSYYEQTVADALLVQGATVTGKSGSTVLSMDQGRIRIIGIQAWQMDALYSPKIAIQVITQEKYAELINAIIKQSDLNYITRTYEPDEIEFDQPTGAFEQVPKNMLVTQDEHVVGDVGRNQIKPSIISSLLPTVGIETKRVPAAMSGRDKRLYHHGSIHPMAHSLGKYYRGKLRPISSNLMNRASHMLINYISSKLDTNNFTPLDLESTITGTREDGSNPMNLKSSPGIPFIFQPRIKKGKKDFMEIGEDGTLEYLDENFVQEYLKFENSLSKGQVPYTRAYDFPKDELRPIAKSLGTDTSPPKTRSVTCMNVFYVLAWRRYTLRFWAAMHRAADGNFSFCPGINPEGPEWNNLYHYLNRHPNAVDFDVSNWDGFYFQQLFYAVLNIIKAVMRISKHSPADFLLDSIFFDVMNCYIQYFDVIYRKERGLVSGFPGTAEVNTLGHWLLALCIYLALTTCTIYNNFQSYLEHLSVAIYGDDILYTFSNEILPIVNGKTLKEEYEKIGYPVTSASKDTEVELSKTLLECRFLKSTWRELIPSYFIRKMDMDVAHDLVHWVRAKQHPEQQFYDNYIDALHIAFGNGMEAFTKFQLAVNTVLSKLGKSNIFYSYTDFELDYYSRYIPELYSSVRLIGTT